MDLAVVKKTLNSASGKALKKYLLSKLYELNSIESINEKDVATHQAIEVKSQKRAYMKLKEILNDIMDIEEDPKKKDPRDSFDVL